jgi:hypothetical protein
MCGVDIRSGGDDEQVKSRRDGQIRRLPERTDEAVFDTDSGTARVGWKALIRPEEPPEHLPFPSGQLVTLLQRDFG